MTDTKICAKCGDRPAGPGGVLCPECTAAINKALNNVWSPEKQLETPPTST